MKKGYFLFALFTGYMAYVTVNGVAAAQQFAKVADRSNNAVEAAINGR